MKIQQFDRFSWHPHIDISPDEEFKETTYDIARMLSLLAAIANQTQLDLEYRDEEDEHRPYFGQSELSIFLLGIRRTADLLASEASRSWEV